MTDRNPMPGGKATVLGWAVPRPTGRWHQAVVVTERHLWITPELTFADNEKLGAAAATGDAEFLDFVRGAGWVSRPARCELVEIQGLHWNATTGLLRIAGANNEVLSAMIPNRSRGTELEPLLRAAITSRLSRI